MTYARIAVNVPSVAGVFDYEIPADLASNLGIGHLVVVPFGNKTVQGVILRFVDTPAVSQTKPIQYALDPDPVLTPAQIALAESLAESTLSPLAAIVDLMLTGGSGFNLIPRLKAGEPGRTVIVYSGFITPEVRERCMALGADAVFQKSGTEGMLAYLTSLRARRPRQ